MRETHQSLLIYTYSPIYSGHFISPSLPCQDEVKVSEGAPTGLIPILECYFSAEMGKKEMSGKLVAFLTHVNDFGECREPIPKFSGQHLP